MMRRPYWLIFLALWSAVRAEERVVKPAQRAPRTLYWPFAPGERWRITHSYTDEEWHGPRIRYALDFQHAEGRAATVGRSVRAAAPGSVVFAQPEDRGGYGRHVIVDHGDGRASLYGHLDRVAVRRGDRVRLLERLGDAGTSGRVNPPGAAHLHFEIRDISAVPEFSRNPTSGWWRAEPVRPDILGTDNFADASPQQPLPRGADGRSSAYTYSLDALAQVPDDELATDLREARGRAARGQSTRGDLPSGKDPLLRDIAEGLTEAYGRPDEKVPPEPDRRSRPEEAGTVENLGPFRFIVPPGWAAAGKRMDEDGRPSLGFGKGGAQDHRLYVTFLEHPGMGPAVDYAPEPILDDIMAELVTNPALGGRRRVVSFRPGVVKGTTTVGKDRIPAVWAREKDLRILLFSYGGKVYMSSARGEEAQRVADRIYRTLEVREDKKQRDR